MEDSLNRYFLIVSQLQQSINSVSATSYENNHKKTLFLSLLDFLSKGAYGKKYSRSGERFINFVENFCDWEHVNRISLPQLVLVLNRTSKDELLDLKHFTTKELSLWPDDQHIPLNYDPERSEVESFLPSGCKVIGDVRLDKLSHVSLLWISRNKLVHEMRFPGKAANVFDFEYPHYHSLGKIVQCASTGKFIMEPEMTWELVYPIPFFNRLIENAVKNLRKYFIENNINPIKSYNLTSNWLE